MVTTLVELHPHLMIWSFNSIPSFFKSYSGLDVGHSNPRQQEIRGSAPFSAQCCGPPFRCPPSTVHTQGLASKAAAQKYWGSLIVLIFLREEPKTISEIPHKLFWNHLTFTWLNQVSKLTEPHWGRAVPDSQHDIRMPTTATSEVQLKIWAALHKLLMLT